MKGNAQVIKNRDKAYRGVLILVLIALFSGFGGISIFTGCAGGFETVEGAKDTATAAPEDGKDVDVGADTDAADKEAEKEEQTLGWPGTEADAAPEERQPSRDPDLPRVVMAVSPFENIGPSEEDDYLGFQISEFITSGMATFDGVQMVERGRLQEVFEEQQLQLSGLTDSDTTSEVGALLNAEQMVVGSFAKTTQALTITGRIIDTETGEVITGTSIESPATESPSTAMRAFLFSLVSGLPEYRVTIPVEAGVETAVQQSQEEAANFARAMEALFRQDDEEALNRLQESVGSTKIGYTRFDEISREYSQVLERVHGQTVFTQLIENQIAHNQELTKQLEPLNVYRSTLQVLSERVASLLAPENITVEADVPGTDSWELGTVSATVPAPEHIHVSLSADAADRITEYFGEQDVVMLTGSGLQLTELPRGELLSGGALANLFELAWQAQIGYGVEFLDREGNPIYRIEAPAERFFAINEGERKAELQASARFQEAQAKSGWELNSDGSVEIQTRELQALDSIRVILLPETLTVEAGFKADCNHLWESLLTHAYRMKSVKAVPQEDEAPAFKEVMITDSWFYSGDSKIDPVPVLPREGKVSGFADLTGVVYFADTATGTITGSWSGAFRGEKSKADTFGENSVLTFPHQERDPMRDILAVNGTAPESPRGNPRENDSPSAIFDVRFQDSARRVEAKLDAGNSWVIELEGGRPDSFAVEAGGVYLSMWGQIKALDALSGEHRWTTEPHAFRNISAMAVAHGRAVGSDLLFFKTRTSSGGRSQTTLYGLDRQTGEKVWQAEPIAGTEDSIAIDNSRVYLSRARNTYAFDQVSGQKVWHADVGGIVTSRAAGAELVYISELGGRRRAFALDASTGDTVWKTRLLSHSIAVTDDFVFLSARPQGPVQKGTHALEAETGRQVWEIPRWGRLAAAEGRVFVSTDQGTYALDAENGRLLWSNSTSDDLLAAGNRLIIGHSVVDAATGDFLGSISGTVDSSMVADRIYVSGGNVIKALDTSIMPSW